MPKRLLHTLLLLLATVLAGACSEEEVSVLSQSEKIEQFLRSTHSPALVAEEEADAEARQPFYTVFARSIYRYIAGYYADPNRPYYPEVGTLSRVRITFRAYVFESKNITPQTLPYLTNDPLLEQAMYAAGLTPGEWSFEPLEIDLRGDILKGLAKALVGCRQGDEVAIYMTYDAAYGGADFGTVPKNSPVCFKVVIDAVY